MRKQAIVALAIVAAGCSSSNGTESQKTDETRAIDAQRARAIAKGDVLAHKNGATESNVEPSEGDLVVHAVGARRPALAYRVVTRAIFGDDPAIWVTTID